MAKKTKKKSGNTKQQNLRTFFRLIIVFLAWLVSSLVPSSPLSFYQTVFVASITAMYEYVIIFLDNQHDRMRSRLALTGLIGSMFYLFLSFLGFSKLIILDLKKLSFHFSNTLPIPDASSIEWSYYYTVYPMVVFPGLIAIELFLKKFEIPLPVLSKTTKQKEEVS